jgi:hypothetical protein
LLVELIHVFHTQKFNVWEIGHSLPVQIPGSTVKKSSSASYLPQVDD